MIGHGINGNSKYFRSILITVSSIFLAMLTGLCISNAQSELLGQSAAVRNSCGMVVDAGNDLFLCSPGGSIQLDGYVDNSAYSFSWSPENLLDDPNILDPTATVSQTTSFILEATEKGPNLIVNSDFDQGNAGFSSEYLYSPTDLIPEGTYAVVASPSSVHPSFQNCNDHTPGPGGNMMVINGAGATNVNIWCQTINNITPDRVYEFSAWLTSVNPSAPAELQFSINGQLLGTTFNASTNTCNWDNFFETWNSGSATSATICIVNQNTALGGNDFALDDIAFNEICIQRDTMLVEVLSPVEETIDTAICAGSDIVFGNQSIDQEGTHVIMLQTSKGCDSILTVNLNVLDPQAFIYEPDTLDCNNSIVSLDGSASVGATDLIFDWTTNDGHFVNNPSGPFVDVDMDGTYSLTVWAEDYGIVCPSQPFEVVVLLDTMTPLVSIEEPGNLNCLPDTISLNANIYPSSGNYLINWTSQNGNIVEGAKSLTPLVDKPGSYVLTLEQLDNGCFVSKSVEVKLDPSTISAVIKSIDTFNCKLDTISLEAIPPGSPDVNYKWTTSDGNIISTPDSTVILIDRAGTYKLTLNDSNNCMDSAIAIVPIDTIRPIFSLSTPEVLSCKNLFDTLSILNYSFLPPSEVVWRSENPTDTVIVLSDSTILVDNTGTYFAILTSDKNGCSHSDTIRVLEDKSPPVFHISNADTLRCASDTVTITSSVQDSGTVMKWVSDNGSIAGPDTGSSLLVTSPAWYVLEVTDTENGCSEVDSVEIIEKHDTLFKKLSISGNTLNCFKTELKLSVSGMGSSAHLNISGSGPEGDLQFYGNDSIVDITSPGLYRITVLDTISGCRKTDSVEIVENYTSPVANVNDGDTLNCLTSSVFLDAGMSEGDSLAFKWYALDDTAMIFSNASTFNANKAGFYILKVTDQSNGCSDIDTVQVFSNNKTPRIQLEEFGVISCRDSSITLDASASDLGPDIVGNWTSPDAGIRGDSTSYLLEVFEEGTYIFTLEDRNTGCIATDSFIVSMDTLSPVAYIPLNDSLTCEKQEVELIPVIESPGDHSFRWTINSQGNITTDKNAKNVKVDQAGSYIIEITDKTNGCISQLTTFVHLDTISPIADAGRDQKLPCDPKRIILDGTASSKGDLYTPHWYHNNGKPLENTDSIYAVSNHTGYHILEITNKQNGCMNTDTVFVSNALPFPANFSLVHENCLSGGEFTLEQGMYNDTAIAFISGIGEIGIEQKLFDLPAGDYQIRIRNHYGCVTDTTFSILPANELSVYLPPSISLTLGEKHQFIPELNIADSLIKYIEWTPAENLDCSRCLYPYVTAWEDKRYILDITDVNGCKGRAETTIKVSGKLPVYIPNSFTPNRDGINDFFTLYHADIIQRILKFEIYDRWGELMYDARNIEPSSELARWDGTFKGEKLSPAVFIYLIEIELKNGRRKTFSGDISLLK